VADALSRLPTEGLDDTPLDDDLPVVAAVTGSAQVVMGRSSKERPLGPVTLAELVEAQAKDAFCVERRKE